MNNRSFPPPFGIMLLLVVSASTGRAAVFPGAQWEFRTPEQAGLRADKLNAVGDFLGGQGCVVRHGYMVYTWGDPARRQDVASACKPVISHFLFKAVEDGRLESLEERVADRFPCLKTLNADLGYKDRDITFRHMATQTSCYGVREKPGAAFDYNDWQMALLWDALFLKVYGAKLDDVDATVLGPLLTEPMQCQDRPTFLAFGPDRAGRLRISARDFARFGLLYLHQGRWRDRQLLRPDLAAMAVRSPLPNAIPRTAGAAAEMCPDQRTLGSQKIPDDQTDHIGSYSFLWWTNGVDRDGNRHWPDAPLDAFGAFGHHNGQRAVVVFPSLDLVISWNDTALGEKRGNPQNEVFKLLMEAVADGPLVVDAEHPAWLRIQGGRPFFLCGPGDPEDFLYRGRRRPDGTRDGDQMALIEKLAGTGANCIYLMAVRSHGGDGDATHNPFLDHDPAKGVNERVLDQWESWFEAMDRAGIVIFFFVYDDGARPFGREFPAGGALKPEEARFLDAIVARFKHHRHLIWCVAEEYAEALTRDHAVRIAEHIKQRDDRRHPVGIHQNHGTRFDFKGQTAFDQFTVQWNKDTPEELHAGAVAAWKDVGGRVNVNVSEFTDTRFGGRNFAGTGRELRRKLWAVALGGGYAMVLGMDIASTPPEDLAACGRLVRFMESTHFNRMSPHDELAGEGCRYVLADPGRAYIAYGEGGDRLTVRVEAGRYRVKWFDPAAGVWTTEEVQTLPAGRRVSIKPPAFGQEAALYLESVDLPPAGALVASASPPAAR